jgi:GTP pyrophosphokinase
VKDPDHLRDKLVGKLCDAKKANRKTLGITTANLFAKINDLAGVRLLHLHTSQFVNINKELLSIFDEDGYRLLEGPVARAWDDESRQFFQSIDVDTKNSPTMYTSVHYILRANSKTTLTCELQVRTLAEELWGEVDHALNYPRPNPSEACRELIRVLARMTSGSSRLVDSIFRAHQETPPAAARGATGRS